MFGQERRVREYGAGDSFSFPNQGIHRMEHAPGAITIHVYSPPIRSLGHYELVDGMLQRTPGDPDDPSPRATLCSTRRGRQRRNLRARYPRDDRRPIAGTTSKNVSGIEACASRPVRRGRGSSQDRRVSTGGE